MKRHLEVILLSIAAGLGFGILFAAGVGHGGVALPVALFFAAALYLLLMLIGFDSDLSP